MNRSAKIGDFMTDAMLKQATKLINITEDASQWAELIDKHVITPNIKDINRKLGQENDPRYISYAVVYAITIAHK